jgi:hypothetical protein
MFATALTAERPGPTLADQALYSLSDVEIQ